MAEKVYIYILTNPSFPDYVKIGYADDVERRLNNLNRSECIPFAFRLYAYYEVARRLTDLKIHDMIDKLNPNLRSIDTFNGKPRKREFYAISKETAYNILESIAEVSGTTDKLHLCEDEVKNNDSQSEAEEIDKIKYDLPTFLSNKKKEIIELHDGVFSGVKSILPQVYEEVTPNYIALRNEHGKNVCEFHLYKSRLLIQTRIPSDPELQIGEKVPDNYLWALNYKINVVTKNDIQKAVQALVDVYNQINK